MDRGFAVVLAVVTSSVLALAVACGFDEVDDTARPPYSTNPGYRPPQGFGGGGDAVEDAGPGGIEGSSGTSGASGTNGAGAGTSGTTTTGSSDVIDAAVDAALGM